VLFCFLFIHKGIALSFIILHSRRIEEKRFFKLFKQGKVTQSRFYWSKKTDLKLRSLYRLRQFYQSVRTYACCRCYMLPLLIFPDPHLDRIHALSQLDVFTQPYDIKFFLTIQCDLNLGSENAILRCVIAISVIVENVGGSKRRTVASQRGGGGYSPFSKIGLKGLPQLSSEILQSLHVVRMQYTFGHR